MIGSFYKNFDISPNNKQGHCPNRRGFTYRYGMFPNYINFKNRRTISSLLSPKSIDLSTHRLWSLEYSAPSHTVVVINRFSLVKAAMNALRVCKLRKTVLLALTSAQIEQGGSQRMGDGRIFLKTFRASLFNDAGQYL